LDDDGQQSVRRTAPPLREKESGTEVRLAIRPTARPNGDDVDDSITVATREDHAPVADAKAQEPGLSTQALDVAGRERVDRHSEARASRSVETPH
jgi:hypothetical protein